MTLKLKNSEKGLQSVVSQLNNDCGWRFVKCDIIERYQASLFTKEASSVTYLDITQMTN